jgi:transposase InsO family protein
VAGVTANPTGAWVVQQARNLPYELTQRARPVKFLIRDRDTKFTASFDEVFRAKGIRIVRTPIRAPRADAFAERFVSTIRRECLDQMLIFGRRHLEAVVPRVRRALQQPPASSIAESATASAQGRGSTQQCRCLTISDGQIGSAGSSMNIA